MHAIIITITCCAAVLYIFLCKKEKNYFKKQGVHALGSPSWATLEDTLKRINIGINISAGLLFFVIFSVMFIS
jgi:hypothetical protein